MMTKRWIFIPLTLLLALGLMSVALAASSRGEDRPHQDAQEDGPERQSPLQTGSKPIEATASPLVDIIQDGSFEAGTPSPYWWEYSTNFGSPLCTVAACGTGSGTGPRTGSWWAWFGGINVYEEGVVSQTVILSPGTAMLSFYLEQTVCADPGDYLEVNVDGTQVFYTDGSSPLCGSLGYAQQTVNLDAYADGGVHVIEFHSEIFGVGTTNFFVDDVTLDNIPLSIELTKTVGTDPAVCATTDGINVATGTDVYYCYEVANTGDITLTLHDLDDSELGTILTAFPFSLSPGSSVFLTQSTTILETTVNTATWTAYNPGPADVASATDTAAVVVPSGCVESAWAPIASINTGRSRLGLAYSPYNGKFYLAGGEATGGNRDNPIEEYDAVTDMWTDKANLLTGVSNTGAAGVGQYIYVPGGFTGVSGIAGMQRYDVQANVVISMTAMPKPNFAHAVVTLDDKIYVLGGSPVGTISNTNYIYDIGADSWITGTAVPTPVNYPAGATDGTYLYLLGGTTSDLATVQRYDPVSDSWDTLPDMGAGRGGPAAFFAAGDLWVVGGGWSSYLSSTEYWDGASWQIGPFTGTGVRTLGVAYGDGMVVKAAGWNGAYETAAEMMLISCDLHLPVVTRN